MASARFLPSHQTAAAASSSLRSFLCRGRERQSATASAISYSPSCHYLVLCMLPSAAKLSSRLKTCSQSNWAVGSTRSDQRGAGGTSKYTLSRVSLINFRNGHEISKVFNKILFCVPIPHAEGAEFSQLIDNEIQIPFLLLLQDNEANK